MDEGRPAVGTSRSPCAPLEKKMHSYHEEASQYAEGSRFLPIEDSKILIAEEKLMRKRHSCPLSWLLTVVFGALLVLQNVYYLVQKTGCRPGPVYDTDFGLSFFWWLFASIPG